MLVAAGCGAAKPPERRSGTTVNSSTQPALSGDPTRFLLAAASLPPGLTYVPRTADEAGDVFAPVKFYAGGLRRQAGLYDKLGMHGVVGWAVGGAGGLGVNGSSYGQDLSQCAAVYRTADDAKAAFARMGQLITLEGTTGTEPTVSQPDSQSGVSPCPFPDTTSAGNDQAQQIGDETVVYNLGGAGNFEGVVRVANVIVATGSSLTALNEAAFVQLLRQVASQIH
jgi:hypothetical protein